MIKKTFNVATCLLTALLLLSSCGPIIDLYDPIFDLFESESEYHYAIIYNNSNDNISIFINFESYPDTAQLMFMPYDLIQPYDRLSPGEKESIINIEKLTDTDTTMIYIYTESIIENFTLQEIYDKHIVAARYDLSKSDLETLNGHICYPPTADMEGMKMYIPEK